MSKGRTIHILAAAILVLGIQAGSPSPSPAYTRISASIVYNSLSPYGSWEYTSHYGNCWVPQETFVGWRPYTVGYWADTDYGWMWISQDPWGDIPYHYGRWAFDSYYGWVWVPDEELIWAPAWVAWRYGDDFVGWAPLPPDAGWGGSGLAISVSFLDTRIPRSGWCFTPVQDFGTTRIRSNLLPVSRNVTLLANTRNVTRYTVYNSLPAERGLRPELIERATGRRIQRYQIVDSPQSTHLRRPAIRGRAIEVFRPRITGGRAELAKFTAQGRGSSRALAQEGRDLSRRNPDAVRSEMRGRQGAEVQAQQAREARQRRSLERQPRMPAEMQRNERQGRMQGRGRGEGQWRDQGPPQGQPDRGQGQGQGQPQNQGQGQSRERQGRGRNQDQGQSDQDKDRGRGHGG